MLDVYAVFGLTTTRWSRVRDRLGDPRTLHAVLDESQADAIGLDPYGGPMCLVGADILALRRRVEPCAAERAEQVTRAVEARVGALRGEVWVQPLVVRAVADDEAMQRWSSVLELLGAAAAQDGIVAWIGD